jgi:heterodisulfide reductase subunit C
MPKIDAIASLAGYRKQDFSACLGCKICASVCTVNDLGLETNPQDLLLGLFLNRNISADHALIRSCTGCYRCTAACPWHIRVPEVIRAIKEELSIESPFERAFKRSVDIWGRVYEPFIFLTALSFIVKEGYVKYMLKWTEYISFHLPHKVRKV